jgi:hypothetical protein
MVFEAVCCIHSVLKLVETLLGMRYNKDKRMRHERPRLIQKEPVLSTGTPLFRENIYVSKNNGAPLVTHAEASCRSKENSCNILLVVESCVETVRASHFPLAKLPLLHFANLLLHVSNLTLSFNVVFNRVAEDWQENKNRKPYYS